MVEDVNVKYRCRKCGVLLDNPGQETCSNGHKLTNNLIIDLDIKDTIALSDAKMQIIAIISEGVEEGKISEEEGNVLKRLVTGSFKKLKEVVKDPYQLTAYTKILQLIVEAAIDNWPN